MASPAGNQKFIRFGVYELDLQERELRKSGVRVKLNDQPFQILCMLLERPGEIVSREELQKRLWPSDTFVDFDLGLNSAVKKLRQALSDDSDNPRFIETLYRRGYRFIGSLNGTVTSQALSMPGPTPLIFPDKHAAEPASRRIPLAALAGMLLLAAGLAYWLWPSQPVRVLGYTQITHDGQPKGGIVTDGERLYFSEIEGDHFVIAQVSANGGETAILPTPFSNVFVGDVAPDGSALLISDFKGTGAASAIWSLPLPVGSPRRLSDISPTAASWSPDGKEMAIATGSDIFLARKDGSEPRKLATAAGLVFNLRFSPDGGRLRFDMYDSKTSDNSLWEVRRDGSNLHPLLPGWNPAPLECCGNWTRDGKYFIFQSFRDGSNNLWALPEKSHWFNRSPKPVQLTNGPLDFSSPVASRDGKRIFSFGAQPRAELLRLDSKTGLVPYFASKSAIDLAFSRDGQWVAYVSIPEHTLWRSRIDGSQPLQLSSTSMFAALPRWSPDGQQIVFMGRTDNTNYRAYLVAANSGQPRELVPGAAIGYDPTWSSDGKSVAVSTSEADFQQPSGISVIDLASGKLAVLPNSGNVFSPRWSPDGKYIAAITKDSQKLMLFDVANRSWSDLVEISAIGFPTWSHDGQYLYFDTTFTEDPAFFRIRISDHKLEKLFSLKGQRRFRAEFGPWTGLAPDDSPLLARDISSQEIYALDWEAP
jgi:Tol biopolymer transport system component/DNA-binding winged helix-turn-helix (wHTH) protein